MMRLRRFWRWLFQRRNPLDGERRLHEQEHQQTMQAIARLEARHERNIEWLRRAGLELDQFEQRAHDDRRRG